MFCWYTHLLANRSSLPMQDSQVDQPQPLAYETFLLIIYPSLCLSIYLIYLSIYLCMYRKGHSYLWWYWFRLCCSPRACWGHLLPDSLLYTLPFSCGGICWQPTYSVGPYGGWAGCSCVMCFCGLIMWVSCDWTDRVSVLTDHVCYTWLNWCVVVIKCCEWIDIDHVSDHKYCIMMSCTIVMWFNHFHLCCHFHWSHTHHVHTCYLCVVTLKVLHAPTHTHTHTYTGLHGWKWGRDGGGRGVPTGDHNLPLQVCGRGMSQELWLQRCQVGWHPNGGELFSLRFSISLPRLQIFAVTQATSADWWTTVLQTQRTDLCHLPYI